MNFTELPVDLRILKTLADNDTEFALELLMLYVKDCLPYVQSLRQSIAVPDYDRIYEAAHYLVGSSSNVGAVKIINAAKQLETLARSQQTGEYEALLAQIEDALDRINLWLQNSEPEFLQV